MPDDQRGPGAASTSPSHAAAIGPAETVVMSRVQLRELLAAGLPGRAPVGRSRHASDLTAEFPAIRCAGGEAGGDPAVGRHRAPAGRHRAAEVTGPRVDPLTRPIRLDDVATWARQVAADPAR